MYADQLLALLLGQLGGYSIFALLVGSVCVVWCLVALRLGCRALCCPGRDRARADEDLLREVAVYAERTDITEEITRLAGHMDQFERLVTNQNGEPVGRTLDFLSQEMLREANTIASKSADAQISSNIVEVKGVIDRIKEQAANVE